MTTRPEMPTLSDAQIVEMAKAIQDFLASITELVSAASMGPAPGALAAVELRTSPAKNLTQSAISLGMIYQEAASDNLLACARGLEGKEPVALHAVATNARAVIEVSARAAWCLDPDIDSRERIARQYALRFESIQSQRKFAAASPYVDTNEQRASDKLAQLEAEAYGLGYSKIVNKDRKGRTKRVGGIGTRMLSNTELAGLIHAEEQYRYLSALVHCQHWAVTEFHYEIERAEPFALARRRFKPNFFALILWDASIPFCRALWSFVSLYGIDQSRVRALFSELFQKLQLSGSGEPWAK